MNVRPMFALLPLLIIACAPRSPEVCDSDLADMRAVINDAVDAAAYCTEDRDCAIVDVSNACESRCPTTVNVDEALTLLSKVHDAELSYCLNYGQDCGFISVSCMEAIPSCVSNRCEMVSP